MRNTLSNYEQQRLVDFGNQLKGKFHANLKERVELLSTYMKYVRVHGYRGRKDEHQSYYKELMRLSKNLDKDLSCDANGTGLPCKTCRLSAVETMLALLELHGFEVG